MKDLTTSIVGWIVIAFAIALCASTCSRSVGASESSCEAMIKWTVEAKHRLLVYGSAKETKAATDADYRHRLAHAFESAANRYDVPVSLLVAMAYYETIYRDLVGDDGRSKGIMQVGKMGQRKCNCDMSTLEGQINCGACWLDMGRKWCKTLEGGLSAYACGECRPTNMRTKRAVNVRLTLAEKLRGIQ